MDNFIVRWYNQNRKTIWMIVLTIIAVISLIQTLNNYYKNNPKNESSSTDITTTYNAPNYSIITQKEIDKTISNESIDLIDNFIEYCNSAQIEKAYNLLSTECKEELYPTVDDFKNQYYNNIFTEIRSYNLELWIVASAKHTYRIQIMPDLLATGRKEYMPIEDYYTITNEDGTYKLNISRFIKKEDINIQKSQMDLDITLESKRIYMDYETYKIKVKNNSEKNLIFNTKQNTDSIYLKDENEMTYIAFLNQIPDNELQISSGETKVLDIKFNRRYKPTMNIRKIVFEDISINEQTIKVEIDL